METKKYTCEPDMIAPNMWIKGTPISGKWMIVSNWKQSENRIKNKMISWSRAKKKKSLNTIDVILKQQKCIQCSLMEKRIETIEIP